MFVRSFDRLFVNVGSSMLLVSGDVLINIYLVSMRITRVPRVGGIVVAVL